MVGGMSSFSSSITMSKLNVVGIFCMPWIIPCDRFPAIGAGEQALAIHGFAGGVFGFAKRDQRIEPRLLVRHVGTKFAVDDALDEVFIRREEAHGAKHGCRRRSGEEIEFQQRLSPLCRSRRRQFGVADGLNSGAGVPARDLFDPARRAGRPPTLLTIRTEHPVNNPHHKLQRLASLKCIRGRNYRPGVFEPSVFSQKLTEGGDGGRHFFRGGGGIQTVFEVLQWKGHEVGFGEAVTLS